jgi:hypothetical protein
MSSSSDEEDGLDVTGKSITSLKNQKCDSSFRETSKRKNRPEDKLCSRLGSQKEERVTSRSENLTRNQIQSNLGKRPPVYNNHYFRFPFPTFREQGNL